MKFCSHDLLKTGHTVCNMFVTGKSSLIFAGQIMHENVAIFIDVYAIFHEPFGVAKNRFAILVPGVDQAWWVRRHSRHEALSLQSLRQKRLNLGLGCRPLMVLALFPKPSFQPLA